MKPIFRRSTGLQREDRSGAQAGGPPPCRVVESLHGRRPAIAICSPALEAVSGVSTHAGLLLQSDLARRYRLLHFQLGSEGRTESGLTRIVRTCLTPLALLRFLLRERPAILHLNTSMARRPICRDAVLALLARCLRVRVVVQIHGGRLPQEMGTSAPGLPAARERWRRTVTHRLLRCVLAWSDTVVVLSRQELQAYRRFCPGLPILRIPNAIDLQALRSPQSSNGGMPVGQAGAGGQGALRLVFVGRLIADKGLFEALDALSLLVDAGRHLEFTIAGSGEAAAALALRVRALHLDDVVQFAGPVAGLRKQSLWQHAEVLLLPSYSEGLPYALLEAMASGTPPITCAVGAIPDVIQDGVQGFLVPPRDSIALAKAIARLDDDRDLLRQMAGASRRRVQEAFTVPHLAARLAVLYDSLLDATL